MWGLGSGVYLLDTKTYSKFSVIKLCIGRVMDSKNSSIEQEV